MEKLKFVITDYIENDLDYELDFAQKIGVDLKSYQLKQADQSELIEAISGAEIILVNMALFNADVIDTLDRCKAILRHGIGYDNADVTAASEKGIVVANYPTYCVEDVAEQALTLMMACQRKLGVQRRLLVESVNAQKWIFEEIYPVYRLHGKTVGIVGLGRIGGTVCNMLSGFGVKILAYDPYLSNHRKSQYCAEFVSFEELLSQSDIITIHCPLNKDETYHMFDETQFRKMKDTSILINTARGGIVNLDELDKALTAGRVGGAGIDVYEVEPPEKDLGILKNEKAVCSPHLSWLSEEAGMAIRKDYMDDVQRIVNGQAPKNVLNPDTAIKQFGALYDDH